jgi:hypothetical protein
MLKTQRVAMPVAEQAVTHGLLQYRSVRLAVAISVKHIAYAGSSSTSEAVADSRAVSKKNIESDFIHRYQSLNRSRCQFRIRNRQFEFRFFSPLISLNACVPCGCGSV